MSCGINSGALLITVNGSKSQLLITRKKVLMKWSFVWNTYWNNHLSRVSLFHVSMWRKLHQNLDQIKGCNIIHGL